jgi:hypothetical protein
LHDQQQQWATSQFTGSYSDARGQAVRFAEYKQSAKRAWVTEKQDIATLFGNVQTKLKTYKLREYVPPPGLSLLVRRGGPRCPAEQTGSRDVQDLDAAWSTLLQSEAKRSRSINAQIRESSATLFGLSD